jgi:uncharacterized integral membrane protein
MSGLPQGNMHHFKVDEKENAEMITTQFSIFGHCLWLCWSHSHIYKDILKIVRFLWICMSVANLKFSWLQIYVPGTVNGKKFANKNYCEIGEL